MKKIFLILVVLVLILGTVTYVRQIQYSSIPFHTEVGYGHVKYYNMDQRDQLYVLNWYTSIGHGEITVLIATLPFILSYI